MSMNKKCNSMYFTDLNEATEFIKHLHQLSLSDSDDLYNDIHTYTEEHAVIVEWEQIPYEHEYGGTFQYVDEDEEVMLYRTFPDNHGEYFHDEGEFNEALTEWLRENPGYVKNSWGRWVREKEDI